MQRKLIERVGQRIGKLVVLSRAANRAEGKAIRATWLCRCDCGNQIIVSAHSLRHAERGKGGTRSCGCLAGKFTRHGLHTSRVYRIWHMMLQRCNNPKSGAYSRYGGRGITVCPEWKDFKNFFSDMGHPPELYTIDRVDNSLGYSKENCRWASRKEQGNNRSTNLFLTFNGKKQTLSQWADETGLPGQCITGRLNRGWSLEKTLTTPKLS